MNTGSAWANDIDQPWTRPVGAGKRLLIAEDDDDMRRMLISALRVDGYEILEARTGLELVEHLQPWLRRAPGGTAIDVVITDVQMPHVSGLEVLRALQRAHGVPPVIIIITAFGDPQLHRSARALGAEFVFDKPFDLDDLRTAVCNSIGRRRPPFPRLT